jgi:hypothetical protein
MPLRNWLRVHQTGLIISAAAFIAVAVAIGITFPHFVGGPRGENKQQNAAQEYRPRRLWAPTLDSPIAKPKAGEYEASCAAPKDREEADLCQQWRSAQAAEEIVAVTDSQFWWNIAQVIATVVAAAATAYAAWAAAKAATSADASIAVSREVARDQSRAYVQAQNAFVVHDGGRKFHVEMVILNSGATPCTWFGYRCHAIYGDVSSAVEFSRDLFKSKPLKRWNGLANGVNDLSLTIGGNEVSEAASLANKSLSGFRIDGVIEYETFFGEVFETEFSFFANPMTDKLLFTSISREDGRQGTKLSRTTRILNSYRRLSG